jgi:hypothetical protein
LCGFYGVMSKNITKPVGIVQAIDGLKKPQIKSGQEEVVAV